MNRRQFITNTSLTIGAVAFANLNAFSQLFKVDPWNIKMLNDTTGVFSEKGGTILFQLNKKGIVVVDTQFPEQSKHLIDEIKKKSSKAFKLLINTHHHGDHTSGNIAFKDIVTEILAHENSKINQEKSAKASKSEDKQLYPTETYTNTVTKKIGKEKITLHYFGAGHTNGDSIVHFEKSNIVHMGDLMFNRRHPFIDRTSGANIKSWIAVLQKTVQTFKDDTQFVFGHSATGFEIVGTKEDIRKFTAYLEALLLFTETEIKAGKTKEEFLKNKTFPNIGEWTGDGIDRPLKAAWEELA
jgi:cyclase